MTTINIQVPGETLSEPGQVVVVPAKLVTPPPITIPSSSVTGAAQQVAVPAQTVPFTDTALAAMLSAVGWTCTPPAPPAPASTWPPFAASSPWNTPIGAGAKFTTIAALQSGLGANSNQERQYWASNAISVSWGTAADPVVQVHLPQGWGWPAQTVSMHVQASVAPPGTADNTICFVDTVTGLVVDLWQASKNADGSWSGASAAQCHLTDSGFGNPATNVGAGIRAVGCSDLGGLITTQDLAAGVINHALALVLPAEMLAAGYQAPAIHTDSGSMNGPIQEGAHLGIAPGTPKPTNLLSAEASMAWDALVKYGAYVVDTDQGSVDPVFQFEVGVTIQQYFTWPFPSGSQPDVNLIGQHIHLVS